jgi:hypothetical protein
MAFPSSPTNNQTATVNGITYIYSTTNRTWTRQAVQAGEKTTTSATPPSNPGPGDVWYNSTNDTILTYMYDGANWWWVDRDGPTFGTGNFIYGNISVSGNIIPTSNVTYNLGTPTQRFQSLYISGNTIDLGGATIKTDFTTGAFAFVPLPTVAIPNPVATVISPSGTLTTVVTTGGNIAAGALSTAANAATTGGNVTIGNLTVSNTAIYNGNIGFSANGSAPLATLDMSTRTDMMLLPVGNTAQRPTTAISGAIRYNTTLGYPEYYSSSNSNWFPFYTSPGYTATFLIVAGGGGGGYNWGGGGGAGGYLTGNATLNGGTSYTITVGAGGAGSSSDANATNGSNSVLTGINTAIGGGGGAYNTTTSAASSGGSGGGGAGNGSGTGYAAGAGTSGQGNAGGVGASSAADSGGGGGAGAAGTAGTSSASGAGGVGLSNSITGTATYYAGGGGGGGNTVGAGGNGGGGSGVSSSGGTGGSASSNLGGGGGGGGQSNGHGGSGGSGVVIISYVNTTQRGSGGTVTSFGSGATTTWVHTFTSSGTYTA